MLIDFARRAWAQAPADRPTFETFRIEAERSAPPPPSSCELLVLSYSPSSGHHRLPAAQQEPQAVQGKCPSWACVVTSGAAATANELRRQLCAHRPRRFLFCGHGDAQNPSAAYRHTLAFAPSSGGGSGYEIVEAAHLRTVLGAQGVDSGGNLGLCVLNACCTEENGRAAREAGVPTVVCWRTETCDPAARLFSTTLFETLALPGAAPRTCREAFDEAVRALRLATAPDPSQPGVSVPKYALRGPTPAELQGTTPLALPYPAGVPVLIDANGTRSGVDVP